MAPGTKQLACRALLAMLVGLVAACSLSSSWVAGLVGVGTVLVVLLDTLAHVPPRPTPPDGGTFTVDLSKRP